MIEWIIFRTAMACLHMAEFSIFMGGIGRDFFIWVADTISEPYREE